MAVNPRTLRQAVRRWWRTARIGSAPEGEDPTPDLRPATSRAGVPLTEVAAAGTSLTAYVVSEFRAEGVLADHGCLVADTLATHDVPFVVLRAEAGQPRIVMVDRAHRREAMSALSRELRETATYVLEPRGRPVVVEARSDDEPEMIKVFRARATAAGRLLSGAELACELQFWAAATDGIGPGGEPVSPDTLIGPRNRLPVIDQLPASVAGVQQREVDGRLRPTLAASAKPNVFNTTAEIDAVYTWVDGADPSWQQTKAAALAAQQPDDLSAVAANDLRYVSRDELRYSLRSLEMYAGWFRHIYLVTADQVPDWLDTSHPKITVVSHRELFGDRGRLPTFNSHAIESQLHHIDGLAEHFVYLNDDVFFARPVPPSTFVLGNGTTRFFLSTLKIAPGPVVETDRPFAAAAKNGRALIEQRFGRTVTHKLQHTPHALRRSVQRELDVEFTEAVQRTASSPFRGATDVSVAAGLGHFYGYLTGRAIPGRVRYLYLDVGMPDIESRLTSLASSRDVDVFCLNDNESSTLDPVEQQQIMIDFLEACYPFPSQFEKATGQPA